MAFSEWSFIVSIKDLINFRKFKADIKKESENRNSKFNRYNMKVNWLGNVIYYQLNCTEEDLQRFDYHPDDMVVYKMKPVIDYMNELEWSEYLVPQINNFVDSEGHMTLSYGILLVYTPFKFRLYKFLTWPLVFGGIGFGLYELIKWILTL